MIPKIIHYCWFGNTPEPELFRDFKNSWEKECPDYLIRRWDESNFDVNCYAYTRRNYQSGRFDLVSDFVRLFVIERFGGLYLDVDVEIIQSLDEILDNQSFFCLEDFDAINSGSIFGAVKHEVNIKNLLYIYKRDNNLIPEYEKNCIEITTDYFRKLGFKYRDKVQVVNGCKIYSTIYFCPGGYGYWGRVPIPKKKTLTIHHYKNQSIKRRVNINIGRLIRRAIGRSAFQKLYSFYKYRS